MGSGWAYRGLAVRLFGLKFACSADDDVLQPANRLWLFQGIETVRVKRISHGHTMPRRGGATPSSTPTLRAFGAGRPSGLGLVRTFAVS